MRTIFAIVAVLAAFKGYSQNNDNESNRFGIQVATELRPRPYKLFPNVHPLTFIEGTYSNDRHQFELGLGFNLSRVRIYEQVVALRPSYTYFTNSRDQLFSGYLNFSMPFYYVTDNPVSEVPVNVSLMEISQAIEHRFWSANISMGYGLQVNLGKRFYLRSDISLQFGLNYRGFDYYDAVAQENKTYTDRQFSIYSIFGLRTGIRF